GSAAGGAAGLGAGAGPRAGEGGALPRDAPLVCARPRADDAGGGRRGAGAGGGGGDGLRRPRRPRCARGGQGAESVRRTVVGMGIVPTGVTVACTSTLSRTVAGMPRPAVLGSAPCTQSESVSGPVAGGAPSIREPRKRKAPAASV